MMRVDAASLRWRRWRHRVDLLSHLARREFSMRYHDSTLGVLWFLAVPLVQLIVLVFLFERVIPLGIQAYPAFVFSGLLPWSWFAASVGSAADCSSATATSLSNLVPLVASLPIPFWGFWSGMAASPAPRCSSCPC
jgi:ABC-type polysaccharide/polyol phosphate export permease